jgi:chromosome partitioning protein
MALEALGLVLPARMHERVIYADSFAHGKTAFEIDPKGIASQELTTIWDSLKGKILENEKVRKPERENVA